MADAELTFPSNFLPPLPARRCDGSPTIRNIFMTEHQFDSADAELMTHGRGVEKLFAFLIVGMGVLALFVLGVFALGQSQSYTARTLQQARPTNQPVPSEIGDGVTTTKR